MTGKIDLIHQNLSVAGIDKMKRQTLDLKKDQELKDACAGFEAIFMNEMLQSMRNTLPGDALFEDSNASDIYQSMQDQNLTENLSKSQNSFGIKDFLYQQLKKSI